jgi:hypothetical protein
MSFKNPLSNEMTWEIELMVNKIKMLDEKRKFQIEATEMITRNNELALARAHKKLTDIWLWTENSDLTYKCRIKGIKALLTNKEMRDISVKDSAFDSMHSP